MKQFLKLFLLIFFSFILYAQENNESSSFTQIDKDESNNLEIFFKEEIKRFLKQEKTPSNLSKNLTLKYYDYNQYNAFFVNEQGIKKIAIDLLNVIRNDPVLKPFEGKIFNLSSIDSQYNKLKSNNILEIEELVKFDFMLVGVYHLYMQILSKGSINWEKFQDELKKLNEKEDIIANWQKYNVYKNIRKLLYTAVQKDDIYYAINKVNYTFPKAKELSNVIQELELIARNGGYTKIPNIKTSLKKNNSYPEIKYLRERLLQSKDLKENNCLNNNKEEIDINENKITANISTHSITNDKISCEDYYDESLFEAVKSFQKRHGLVDDGIVGKKTISELNVNIEEKIKTIRINLERMRWLPRTLGENFLLINIPEFHLKYFKEGEIKLQMPVIVGEKEHPTPIFSHKISSIVLNPYWRIPQRIVKNEIIPKLVEDPSYLEKEEIKIFENWDHESMSFDTSLIDWSMYLDNDLIGTPESAPMRFIQIPGKKNPLGRIKFMFPNKYSVYLHDTPFKGLFQKNVRAFSHGCIRVSKPYKLLKIIAEEENAFTYEESKKILKDIEKTDIDLNRKIPVHIIYLTAWIDEKDVLHFRDDIYNYDKMHEKFIYEKENFNYLKRNF